MACCIMKETWKLLNITEHYSDTSGFTEDVFARMHLLGFAFAPRIRDLHDNRLFIHGKAERYPGGQSVISTTSPEYQRH
ncbi:Tn3 family transposase [Escherichia coli]